MGLAHAELCYVKIKTFSPIEGEGQAMLIFFALKINVCWLNLREDEGYYQDLVQSLNYVLQIFFV